MYSIWNTLFIFIIMLFSCIRYRNSSVSMLAMLDDCMKYLSFSIVVAEIKCSKVRKISFLPSTVQEPDLIVSVLASWKCTAVSPKDQKYIFYQFLYWKKPVGFPSTNLEDILLTTDSFRRLLPLTYISSNNINSPSPLTLLMLVASCSSFFLTKRKLALFVTLYLDDR